jgi:hypothetical protein
VNQTTDDAQSPLTLQGTVFGVLWATTLLYDRVVRGMAVDPWSLAVVVAAVAVLLRPSCVGRLVTLAVVHLVWFGFHVSHALYIHWFLTAIVDTVIVVGAVATRLQGPLTHARLTSTVASSLRWILLIALFSAGFSKLNTSFLNPDTSCAVALLEFQRVTFPFSLLPDASWTQSAAIYVTLIAELGAPLMLCVRRTRMLGMLLAAGFFFLIGTNPQAKLYEFSTIFVSLMLFFAPAELFVRIRDQLRGHAAAARVRWLLASAAWRRARPFLVAALVYLGVYLVSYSEIEPLAREHRFFVARLSYAVGLPALVALYVWGCFVLRTTQQSAVPMLFSRPRALLVLPLLFFVHEASTYLGYKRSPTVTMAGNLMIERGYSNHIVVTGLPELEGNRVVTLVRSSDPLFDGKGRRGVTWAGFRDYLARNPDTSVTFELEGVRESITRAGDDPRFAHPSFWDALLTRSGDRHPHGRPYTFRLLDGDKRCHHRVEPWLEKRKKADEKRARRRKELRRHGIFLP